jgi:hypothetical protein
MIVIVEGPDGSGKSTLVDALSARKNVHVRHWGVVDEPYKVYSEELDRFLESDTPHAVYDRFWPSEDVYGNVLRGGNRLSAGDRRLLRWRALTAGVVVILCAPPDGAIAQNVAGSDQLEGVDDELRAICDRYWGMDFKLPTETYDYNTRRVMDWAELEGGASRTIDLPGSGCAEKGNMIIVYSSEKVHTSVWFADQMAKTQYDERDLFWVHADDFSSRHVSEIEPRAVKTLGQTALKKLQGTEFTFQPYENPFLKQPEQTPTIIQSLSL